MSIGCVASAVSRRKVCVFESRRWGKQMWRRRGTCFRGGRCQLEQGDCVEMGMVNERIEHCTRQRTRPLPLGEKPYKFPVSFCSHTSAGASPEHEDRAGDRHTHLRK